MLKEKNSRWISESAVLFCIQEVYFGKSSFPQMMTSMHMNQIGEALETCMGMMIVCVIDDCPIESIWGFFLFHSSSFEVYFMNRWPPSCLTEYSITVTQGWFGHRILKASCGPGTGVGTGEESRPLEFPASRWWEDGGECGNGPLTGCPSLGA